MCSSYDCLDANNNSLKNEQNIYIFFIMNILLLSFGDMFFCKKDIL